MDEAYEAIQTSTRMAREANIDQLIYAALRTEAEWAGWREDFAHAHDCLNEGLRCIAETEVKQDWQSASLLVRRAWLWLREENAERAAQDLKAAEPALLPYANATRLVRPLLDLEHWWWATAWLRLNQEDEDRTRAAAQEALRLSRLTGSYLTDALENFALIHENLGDSEAAETARQEASAIK